ARLPDVAARGVDAGLGAVDGLAAAEVELVEGAPTGEPPLGAELDPLGVLDALAHLDHKAHRPALVRQGAGHPREGFARTLERLVAADAQRRFGVQPDAVDWGEEGDDREGVRDEVGDHADLGRSAGLRLLLQALELYL